MCIKLLEIKGQVRVGLHYNRKRWYYYTEDYIVIMIFNVIEIARVLFGKLHICVAVNSQKQGGVQKYLWKTQHWGGLNYQYCNGSHVKFSLKCNFTPRSQPNSTHCRILKDAKKWARGWEEGRGEVGCPGGRWSCPPLIRGRSWQMKSQLVDSLSALALQGSGQI